MTTLAIYGDSYADCTHGHDFESGVTDAMGWPNLLAKRGYSLDNYSRGGTSLYWSYQQFIQTHQRYEKIIFVATVPGRWTGTVTIDSSVRYINSYWLAQDLLADDSQVSPAVRQQLERVSDYYLYVQDMIFEETAHDLMLAEVRRLRPDSVIVPTASCASDTRSDTTTANLGSFTDVFVRSCRWARQPGPTESGWHTLWRERAMICHMTPEINQLVAEQMQASLVQRKYLQTLPQTLAHQHPGDYYVTLI